jgi:hypothetical protein
MTTPSMKASWTTPQTVEAVRPQVRELLMAVPSFAQMTSQEKTALAGNLVKVLSYIANPNGVAEEVSELARAQGDDPVEDTKKSLSKSPGMVGDKFKAGAVREGVDQFVALAKKVDFPKFVGGLIKNVFQAIVESSIEQMRAYGELIANVAKTVDQFMTDNISAGAGRDWLADRYPDDLGVEVNTPDAGFAVEGEAPGPQAMLTYKGDDPAVRLSEISRDLNLNPPVTDITDANAELRLTTAARLHMAKSRQQLLASMVMLGINRIVVTDGSITAKVVFDMRAEDKAKRKYTASMYDQSAQRYKESMNASYGGWMTPVDVSTSFEGEQDHVATVGSAVDETSESKAEVKARLSGDVRVNFKSDYLPLEKMATPEMMSVIQGNSTPYNPNVRPAATSGTQK